MNKYNNYAITPATVYKRLPIMIMNHTLAFCVLCTAVIPNTPEIDRGTDPSPAPIIVTGNTMVGPPSDAVVFAYNRAYAEKDSDNIGVVLYNISSQPQMISQQK